MFIQNLQINQFKNLHQFKQSFEGEFIGITGKNGVGKTTILDAIYYLSITKSYINHQDKHNIAFGKDFFTLKGNFVTPTDQYAIQLSVQEGSKKTVKKNNKAYPKLSDHIGLVKTVVISPYDRDLIWEGSDVRRKYLDHLISQIDSTYLEQLIRYNKVLNQRNAILKFFKENHSFEQAALDPYEEEMKMAGSYIFQKRNDIVAELSPIFKEIYKEIAQVQETVNIAYESDLELASWQKLFEENLQKDRLSGFTHKGVHKDDLLFTLYDNPVKRVGSQGQQKSFVIALKLAQVQYLSKVSNDRPIMLLDDIFDKLDESRVQHLVQWIGHKNYGQVFLTDTDEGRINKVLSNIDKPTQNVLL